MFREGKEAEQMQKIMIAETLVSSLNKKGIVLEPKERIVLVNKVNQVFDRIPPEGDMSLSERIDQVVDILLANVDGVLAQSNDIDRARLEEILRVLKNVVQDKKEELDALGGSNFVANDNKIEN